MKKEIDLNAINKLCQMSQLEFSEDDKITLMHEVQSITQLLDNMKEVPEESSFLHTQKISDLRKDTPCESMDKSDVFQNAPRSCSDYFVVPKVVD